MSPQGPPRPNWVTVRQQQPGAMVRVVKPGPGPVQVQQPQRQIQVPQVQVQQQTVKPGMGVPRPLVIRQAPIPGAAPQQLNVIRPGNMRAGPGQNMMVRTRMVGK